MWNIYLGKVNLNTMKEVQNATGVRKNHHQISLIYWMRNAHILFESESRRKWSKIYNICLL